MVLQDNKNVCPPVLRVLSMEMKSSGWAIEEMNLVMLVLGGVRIFTTALHPL